jgi:hypothetical protein
VNSPGRQSRFDSPKKPKRSNGQNRAEKTLGNRELFRYSLRRKPIRMTKAGQKLLAYEALIERNPELEQRCSASDLLCFDQMLVCLSRDRFRAYLEGTLADGNEQDILDYLFIFMQRLLHSAHCIELMSSTDRLRKFRMVYHAARVALKR